MARTFRTLSLSLPPAVVEELVAIGKPSGRTGARVAAEIVLRAVAETPGKEETRYRKSWCCSSGVVPVQGQLVMPEKPDGKRCWMPVIALLCAACGKQLHGREYEGWIGGDA